MINVFFTFHSEIPNVESPESIGSTSPDYPGAGSTNNKQFSHNSISIDEIGNFFLDEMNAGSCSSMNYDDIDEIDTNNMEIYDNEKLAPLIKKEFLRQEKKTKAKNSLSMKNNQQKSAQKSEVQTLQQQFKKEPVDNQPTLVTPTQFKVSKNPQSASNSQNSSLLLPKNNQGYKKPVEATKTTSSVDNDLLAQFLVANNANQVEPMNSAAQTTQPSSSGKSLNNGKNLNDFLVTNEMPQTIFDENSQVIFLSNFYPKVNFNFEFSFRDSWATTYNCLVEHMMKMVWPITRIMLKRLDK